MRRLLADAYYFAYVKAGGRLPREKLFNDFLIVACASVHGIDIVISEDNATLASELSLLAYQKVNHEQKLSFPQFIKYEEFKHIIRTSFPNPVINSSDKFGIFLGIFYIFPRVNFCFSLHNLLKESLIYKSFVIESDA